LLYIQHIGNMQSDGQLNVKADRGRAVRGFSDLTLRPALGLYLDMNKTRRNPRPEQPGPPYQKWRCNSSIRET
jgi:hypothetical protein